MGDKIEELEIALSHQEIQIRDLSDMVNRQWKEIDRLKRHLSVTQEKLGDLESAAKEAGISVNSVTDIAASEKPPHY